MSDRVSFLSGGAHPLDLRYQRAGSYQATIQPLVWVAFPFAASCSDFGSGFQPCKYAIDVLGIVHLRGALAFSGTPSSPQTIGTMPTGFRPVAQEGGFAQIGTYTGGPVGFLVDVLPTGAVKVTSTAGVPWTGAFLSLSGITYATN